jgi:hypothetical protein
MIFSEMSNKVSLHCKFVNKIFQLTLIRKDSEDFAISSVVYCISKASSLQDLFTSLIFH